MNYLSFGHPGLSGFSFAIKKSAYDAAGGFDPETDCYEDLELAQRVHKIGKIILVTDPPIIFSGRRFQKSFLKGYLEYVSAFFQMFVLRRKRVFLSDPRVGDKGRK
jgi:GT2 family glycosyltransferase